MIFVMLKPGVLFEVRTESLNIIQTSFGFRRLQLLCGDNGGSRFSGIYITAQKEFLCVVQSK
jgi:hypothetical protein